jgi:hypothetical protein
MTKLSSLILPELKVSDLSKDSDSKYFVAYKDRLFILGDKSKLVKVLKHFKEHPALKKSDYSPLNRKEQDPYSTVNSLADYAPDIVAGEYDPDNDRITILTNSGVNPETSLMVKKIAKQLRIGRAVTYKSDDETGAEDEVEVPTSDMEGGVPKIVYHGTSTVHLEEILKYGLAPDRGPSKWQGAGIYHPNHIFFAASIHDATFYAHNAVRHSEQKWGNYPIVIEFTVPDPALLGPDYDADQQSTTTRHFDRQTQTNKHTHDQSDMKSMGLSREIGKWSYEGRIPAQFIRWIYYYDHGLQQWKKSKPSTWRKLLSKADFDTLGQTPIGTHGRRKKEG